MGQQGCNNSGRELLVAALPAQLDAQCWGVQQAGQGEGAACQGQLAPGPKGDTSSSRNGWLG
ncbi:hypothetical protein HaLaN_21682 [Haematococcus lacustris]|uniref:Uncharacterized protein n=1 Tax=Haematococcus lacustris TaxID=44745 RepID=A0A699ZYW4_HAELA|nr:hypothetical protein HaLaN_21682 [Haematococcus lacustris]